MKARAGKIVAKLMVRYGQKIEREVFQRQALTRFVRRHSIGKFWSLYSWYGIGELQRQQQLDGIFASMFEPF